MAKKQNRIPKSLSEKVLDLDDHMYLLRMNLKELNNNSSHLKILTTELRTLLCFSSGTEGLLWRLVDELKVSDLVHVHATGGVNKDHPLARGLQFAVAIMCRAGKGDPGLPPNYYPYKSLIKDHEAVFVNGKSISHEYLIKALSQQIGSAHEDDGIEPAIKNIQSILINGVEPYFPIIAVDVDLAIEIGERVLEKAQEKIGYKRRIHSNEFGDVSFCLRLRKNEILAGLAPISKSTSLISRLVLQTTATPSGIKFAVSRSGTSVFEITAEYPSKWNIGDDAVFVFSYSSSMGKARVMVNDSTIPPVDAPKIGWIFAQDLVTEFDSNAGTFISTLLLLGYERLLSPKESCALALVPPDSFGAVLLPKPTKKSFPE